MAHNILIVEDKDDMRETLADRFREEGFEVEEAKHGQNGLDRVMERKPDMILLDIIMPEMDGVTFLKKLESQGLSDIPVIVLTNLSSHRSVDSALRHGAESFLVKSDWDLKDIVEKVRNEISVPSEEESSS